MRYLPTGVRFFSLSLAFPSRTSTVASFVAVLGAEHDGAVRADVAVEA